MQKNAVILFSVFVLSAGTAIAADFSGFTGLNYDWWEDSRDSTAQQAFVPFEAEARLGNFSMALLTGYASTRINPGDEPARSLSHMLDTKVNLSYSVLDRLPVDVLIGLDFNLPTGKTDLNENDLVLIMDPDLISINNFGEGFNVNPTLSISKTWKKWAAGVGVGYSWRGQYDFSHNSRNYDPGNIFTLTGELRYDFLPSWSGRFFGNYSRYNKATWRQVGIGNDSYEEGDFLLLGLGLYYTKQEWDGGLTLRSIFRGKSKFQEEGQLVTEERNIHGNEWVGDLFLRYFLNEKTAVKAFLQGRLIAGNDYPSSLGVAGSQDRFIGRRKKITLGLGLSRVLSTHLEGEIYVKGFLKHDEEALFPQPEPERNFHGISSGFQVNWRF